jgi:hypothetical protein
MAKYSELTDYTDSMIEIIESYLIDADTFIDLKLFERGINSDDLTLPINVLTQIAVNYAKRLACIEQARDENSPLIPKAREYEKTMNMLLSTLTAESLGIETPAGSGGYFSFDIGRG